MGADPIPPHADARSGSDAFTSLRIERIVTLAVGVGAAAVGTQAFLVWARSPEIRDVEHQILAAGVFLPLLLMVLACITGYAVKVSSTLFAVVFPIAIVLAPLLTGQDGRPAADLPWTWFLLNICTVAAVVGLPLPMQIAWAIGVPALFGAVRVVELGGSDLLAVVLDVVFSLIVGAVLVALGWMLRGMARDIDSARVAAVEVFARAAEAEAEERERVAVAALMHDSVLAALIAASRAGSDREAALAAAMAQDALTRLADADRIGETGGPDPVPATVIAAELARACEALGLEPSWEVAIVPETVEVPGPVAGAIVQAAAQAVANAAEHARGCDLHLRVDASARRVAVVVRDTGDGFDVGAVPDDRLGVRGSIIARMAAVAGRATVDSGRAGTTVRLVWEAGS